MATVRRPSWRRSRSSAGSRSSCVTAGTRNHFAQDLGLDREDPRTSVHAFRDAIERRIDYATVNDRFFVNNVSLGVYAALVQQDGYRDAKVETTKTMLPELLGKTERAVRSPVRRRRTAPRSTARSSSRCRTTRTRSAPRSTPGNDAASTPASSVSSPSPEPPGKDAAGAPRPRCRRSTQPQPELARVHHRALRGSLAIGYGVRRRRRGGARDGDPDGVPHPSRRPSSPGARRKPRRGGATTRPQRQPPRPARRRDGASHDVADLVGGAGARQPASVLRHIVALGGDGLASHFDRQPGRPRPDPCGRSQ